MADNRALGWPAGPSMFLLQHRFKGTIVRQYSEEQLTLFLEKEEITDWWIYVLTQPETQEGDEDGRTNSE